MSKLTTLTVPTATGTTTVSGYVANIPLNIGRTDMPDAPTVKFFIVVDANGKPENLTHYASGKMFHSHLLDANISYRLRHGTDAPRLSNRALAEEAVFNAVKNFGLPAILKALNEAPVINR